MTAERDRKLSPVRLLLVILPMVFAGSPWLFITGNLVGIIHGVSHGFNTYVSQRFFDAVAAAAAGGPAAGALWMAAALGGAVLASQALNGVHNFMSTCLFRKMEGHLNMRIHEKAGRIDPVCYESPALLDDIGKAREGAGNSMGLMFTAITLFTFYLPYFLFMGAYLFSLKPALALSLLFVFVPVALTQIVRGAAFARLADQAAPVRRQYEYYERCVCDREFFKETRILGAFGYFRDLYRQALALLGSKVWETERRTGLMELGMKMLTLAGYFGVLYLLFAALLRGEITVGAFAAVFASIGLMFGIMDEIVCRHIGSMTKNLGTVRNFVRFMALPERCGRQAEVDAGSGVALNDVTFRYPGAEADAVCGVTLHINAGETVAIVGENGAGKTTLVRLITGLYLPGGGSVTLGGTDTADVSAQSAYRGITAVFQKHQRYKMTLEDNVTIGGHGEGTDAALLAGAAVKAELDAASAEYPGGWETMLAREFDGVDLSGGQWQRVAIARGFYRAHGMIVLDEPTAAIDPLEESRIYRKFAELSEGKTAVIVTHRLGSARIADRIVVMEQGRVAAVGTHGELMAAGGLYAHMYRAQAQWYERGDGAETVLG